MVSPGTARCLLPGLTGENGATIGALVEHRLCKEGRLSLLPLLSVRPQGGRLACHLPQHHSPSSASAKLRASSAAEGASTTASKVSNAALEKSKWTWGAKPVFQEAASPAKRSVGHPRLPSLQAPCTEAHLSGCVVKKPGMQGPLLKQGRAARQGREETSSSYQQTTLPTCVEDPAGHARQMARSLHPRSSRRHRHSESGLRRAQNRTPQATLGRTAPAKLPAAEFEARLVASDRWEGGGRVEA